MNIFRLHDNPTTAAHMMCDKHVVKMVIEYGQLLSTAHRILDGEEYTDRTKAGRRIKRWRLREKSLEKQIYKACHVNHPSAIWTRENLKNYRWLYDHFVACAKEYEHRYGRVHETFRKLKNILSVAPTNIKETDNETTMPQCMPDYCKQPIVTEGYRKYYRNEKRYFAKWTNREVPRWFQES